MTSQSRGSEAHASELARRLRSLRLHHWDEAVKQPDLGKVLGVGTSSVSSWENVDAPKVPPEVRLRGYAMFFASRRSLDSDPPRLLREDELTDDERAERDRILRDLTSLRTAAVGEIGPSAVNVPRSPWHFPDGGPVRIICGTLSESNRPAFASTANHNYMALSGYADLDALVELFGHIRAENPASDVRFETTNSFKSDDLKAHLVLLGGMARMQGEGRILSLGETPVRQVEDDRRQLDGEIFEVAGSEPPRRFGPRLAGDNPRGEVVEDVGLLLRTPNPHYSTRTLTICSGVFTRGVYGAVRCLTDRDLRGENAEYLRGRFADAPTFALLMRVQVADHTVPTPDLRVDKNRLYEFPPAPDRHT
ncbi:MAG: XRE family transcriptional regulator [Pseudonocardiaceae bacterium]